VTQFTTGGVAAKVETVFNLSDLFLASLLGGFGCLTTGSVRFFDGLDNTDSNSLSHVTDGESTKWWVGGESFNAHWLGWGHLDDSSITRFDLLWEVFHLLTGTSVDLFEQFSEFAGDVSGVAIQNWRVTVSDFTRVVQDNNLSVESLGFLGWIVLGVGGNVSTSDILDGDVLDVETNVVTWSGFWERFVVHLNGLDFSGDVDWSEGDDHTWFDETSFDTTDWDCSDTTNFVDILEWESKWFVGWTGWWDDGIEGFEHSFAREFSFFDFLVPSLVPWHVGGSFNHVISVPSRDWDKGNSLWIVTNLLDVVGNFR